MKRTLIIVLMFWNLLFGADAQSQAPGWANKSRYEQANKDIMSQPPDLHRVVLMGNSITEFWAETHPQFFADNHLVGRGISGQVSSQMLVRFRQDVLNLYPRAVVINCGTNDIAENNGPYDEDITVDNIRSMAELAHSHGIDVVLSSVLPCDRFVWNPSVNGVQGKIASLNRRIIQLAEELNLPYIDYFTPMETGEQHALNPAYTEDGVHPNAAGYDVMEGVLLKVIGQHDPTSPQ